MQIDTVYLAPYGFTPQLTEELIRAGLHIVFTRDRLIGVKGPAYKAVWAENTWFTPRFQHTESISQAAKTLKSIQRNWALYATEESGRSKLIQEALPRISVKPFIFGTPLPKAPMGSWTMWDRNTILYSAECDSAFASGKVEFAENKKDPPNRAYLKLWEGLTRLQRMPVPGDVCLDLGSSPGGWSWVIAELGAHVFSVDKAPLAPGIARHRRIDHCEGSAFALEPKIVGPVSWLFCDIACYPERLYSLVDKWLTEGECQNFFCTIKFTGKENCLTDFATLERFTAIPGSFAMHLHVNKHEVTWVKLADAPATPFIDSEFAQ